MAKRKSTTVKKNTMKKTIDDLYKVMVEEDLLELQIKNSKLKVDIKRKGSFAAPPATASSKPEEAKTSHFIRSPMNGIFYASSTPGEMPFVKENDEISPGTTVCILEAMKLMNEVQVETQCRILKILAEDGASVEVNQPLFEIENL